MVCCRHRCSRLFPYLLVLYNVESCINNSRLPVLAGQRRGAIGCAVCFLILRQFSWLWQHWPAVSHFVHRMKGVDWLYGPIRGKHIWHPSNGHDMKWLEDYWKMLYIHTWSYMLTCHTMLYYVIKFRRHQRFQEIDGCVWCLSSLACETPNGA